MPARPRLHACGLHAHSGKTKAPCLRAPCSQWQDQGSMLAVARPRRSACSAQNSLLGVSFASLSVPHANLACTSKLGQAMTLTCKEHHQHVLAGTD
eukprot:1161215-Pelagomonas_calceolata.AAC.2